MPETSGRTIPGMDCETYRYGYIDTGIGIDMGACYVYTLNVYTRHGER